MFNKKWETHDKPLFENNTVSYVDPNLNVTKVNKVYTAQVISDDPDEKCETGQHIRKIYSNQTNTTRTQTNSRTTHIITRIILLAVEFESLNSTINVILVMLSVICRDNGVNCNFKLFASSWTGWWFNVSKSTRNEVNC